MWFVTFIFKNILRRPIRSALTGIGVALAVGAVVSLLGISYGFERSFMQLFDARDVDMVVLRAGITERLTSNIDADIGEMLEELPHVRMVDGGLMDVVAFPERNLINVPIQGLAPDSFLLDDLKFLEGRRLEAGDRRGVMLGTVLARDLGKKKGDVIEIDYEEFHVAGVYESFNVFENKSAVMLLDDLQTLMDRPNRVTLFQVVLEDVPDKKEVIEQLRRQVASLCNNKGKPLKLEGFPTDKYVKSTLQIKLAQSMAWTTSVIALVIGSIGILNTMIMSVFERTREIGILRAIGWRKSRIMLMILGESFLLCLGGAVVGTFGAIAFNKWLSTMSAAEGYVQGTVSAGVIALGFLIALLVGLVGGIYPAYRGASLLPTEAIRHE